jgi:hypothetical protein
LCRIRRKVMKYVKMLGLAAVAAMAVMAFLGASSASATVLCSEANTTTNCSEKGKDYPEKTALDASLKPGTKAVLNASGIIDECSESTVKGSTANTGGATETVHGEVTVANLTWGKCTAESTVTTHAGQLEIHWISGTDNGTVTAKEVAVTVKSAGLSCTYGAGTGIDLGTLVGGSPATLSIETEVTVTGGFLCPPKATWKAEYVVTEPSELWVSEK